MSYDRISHLCLRRVTTFTGQMKRDVAAGLGAGFGKPHAVLGVSPVNDNPNPRTISRFLASLISKLRGYGIGPTSASIAAIVDSIFAVTIFSCVHDIVISTCSSTIFANSCRDGACAILLNTILKVPLPTLVRWKSEKQTLKSGDLVTPMPRQRRRPQRRPGRWG